MSSHFTFNMYNSLLITILNQIFDITENGYVSPANTNCLLTMKNKVEITISYRDNVLLSRNIW